MLTIGELTVEAYEEILRKNVQEEITNLEDRLHLRLSKQFGHVENRIKIVEERLEIVERRLEVLENSLSDLQKLFGRMIDLLEKHARRIDDLADRVERLEKAQP